MERVLLFSLILGLSYRWSSVSASPTRVVGGFEAPPVFGRYQASLQNLTGSHVCGGAVVSERHVVTAAHCVMGADPEYIKIVVGTSDLDIGGEQYDVESIEIHKDFNFGSRANDIAIMKTAQPFVRDNVEILKLGSNELVDGDTVTLTGFGAIEANGESSRRLHILNLHVFSQDTCQYAMRYTREVSDTMFCTFNRIGQGTCHGDSGSPLVMEGQLVGLVSWGIPCATGFPDVHTRTILYNDWIQNEINKQRMTIS